MTPGLLKLLFHLVYLSHCYSSLSLTLRFSFSSRSFSFPAVASCLPLFSFPISCIPRSSLLPLPSVFPRYLLLHHPSVTTSLISQPSSLTLLPPPKEAETQRGGARGRHALVVILWSHFILQLGINSRRRKSPIIINRLPRLIRELSEITTAGCVLRAGGREEVLGEGWGGLWGREKKLGNCREGGQSAS